MITATCFLKEAAALYTQKTGESRPDLPTTQDGLLRLAGAGLRLSRRPPHPLPPRAAPVRAPHTLLSASGLLPQAKLQLSFFQISSSFRNSTLLILRELTSFVGKEEKRIDKNLTLSEIRPEWDRQPFMPAKLSEQALEEAKHRQQGLAVDLVTYPHAIAFLRGRKCSREFSCVLPTGVRRVSATPHRACQQREWRDFISRDGCVAAGSPAEASCHFAARFGGVCRGPAPAPIAGWDAAPAG